MPAGASPLCVVRRVSQMSTPPSAPCACDPRREAGLPEQRLDDRLEAAPLDQLEDLARPAVERGRASPARRGEFAASRSKALRQLGDAAGTNQPRGDRPRQALQLGVEAACA
jgi:hypothetical protein